MAEVVKLDWNASPASGMARRDRVTCAFEAYVPDPLAGRDMSLDGDVAAEVADAEVAIARLNATARALVDTETLARLLLRAESVASSRLEGLEVGPRRLLRAEAGRELGVDARDVTAAEVLANLDAMVWATRTVTEGGAITLEHLLTAHRRLLAGTRLQDHGGHVRTVQDWIGGSAYNPCRAGFVPPPPERVMGLLRDLVEFCNGDRLPAVAQAAIAHAQFETIHPFVDGNGRIGRALIHMVLRRRGLAPRLLPPVSPVLATWATDYVAGLAAERIEESWRERVGRIRAGSATDLLLRALAGAPVLTVGGAAMLLGRSFRATNEAVSRLVDADVLSQITVGRRNRAFEAREIVDAFTALERRLASPDGDTRTSPPARPAPRGALR